MFPVHSMDRQTIRLDGRQMRTAGNHGDLGPGFVQAGGKVTADRAGTIDAYFHGEPL
jgi:hypothetical protein